MEIKLDFENCLRDKEFLSLLWKKHCDSDMTPEFWEKPTEEIKSYLEKAMKSLSEFVKLHQDHLEKCEDPDYLLRYEKRMPKFPGSDEQHKKAAEKTARHVKGYRLILKIMTGSDPLAHIPSHCVTTSTSTHIDWESIPEDEASIGTTMLHRSGGNILCMPLFVNAPDPKSPSWKLTTCPECRRGCWETDSHREILKRGYNYIAIALCTECALRSARVQEDFQ